MSHNTPINRSVTFMAEIQRKSKWLPTTSLWLLKGKMDRGALMCKSTTGCKFKAAGANRLLNSDAPQTSRPCSCLFVINDWGAGPKVWGLLYLKQALTWTATVSLSPVAVTTTTAAHVKKALSVKFQSSWITSHSLTERQMLIWCEPPKRRGTKCTFIL